MTSSLTLTMPKHQIQALADQAGVEDIESLINDLEPGYAWDREDSGHWKEEPIIEFNVPVFGLGFARRARIKAQIQQFNTAYTSRMISIRGDT